jgi:CHAD domain-containing protein
LPAQADIREYARDQISARLGRLAFEIRASSRSKEPDTIHDLRVSIRRFEQSLDAFAGLLPGAVRKKIARRLRALFNAAGAIRNRDIADKFLDTAGVPPEDPLRARIGSERRLLERALEKELRGCRRSNFSAKWRAALDLEPPARKPRPFHATQALEAAS